MQKLGIIPAGTILLLERGEYSDWIYDGPFTVMKDLDQAACAALFRAEWKPEGVHTRPYPSQFVAWLAKNQFIEDVDGATSWNIGGSEFDPF